MCGSASQISGGRPRRFASVPEGKTCCFKKNHHRNQGALFDELPSYGCTDSSLPPTDLASAGHEDQERGVGVMQ